MAASSPATRWGCPASRRATTSSCAAAPERPWSPGAPTTCSARSSRCRPPTAPTWSPRSSSDLQSRAEAALATLGSGAPAAALVAIRPSDGAILATANGAGAAGADLAATGQYAPGSTFKVVSSLALLRSGLAVDDVVSCPATTVVDGRSFKNYDDYPSSALGDIPFVQAIAQSCNTALIANADRLAAGDLSAAAAALGLGVDHDLGFGVYFGQVPPAETETGAAADLIGQGTVLASPFAMATVAASVAAGRTVLPVLLPGPRGAAGRAGGAAHRAGRPAPSVG